MDADTKNLGNRSKLIVRLGPSAFDYAVAIAKLTAMPINSVVVLGVCLLGAQFAPLIAARGLSLDILEEEMRALFAEARRVVETKPAPPRKLVK
jgi:hypothetical protein